MLAVTTVLVIFQAKVQRKSSEKALATEIENNLTISNLESKLQACEAALQDLDKSSSS